MKKAFSKSLSWLLSVVMIFGIFVVGDLTEVNATGSITTQDIQRVLDKYGYTTGSYWTMWDYPNSGSSDCGATVQTINSELYASSNPATSSSSQSWKSYNFNNSWQCHGFALYVMSKVTGNTVSSAGGTNWTKITSKPSYLQVGDIIRTSQHTAVVLTADNGTYTFAECWGGSQNKISIGKGFNYSYYTLDSITSRYSFQYVLRYGGSPAPVSYNPEGHLDGVDSPEAGKLHVAGWAFDRDDVNASLGIHIYVGGTFAGEISAWKGRADVNGSFPGVGDYHGFEETIDVWQSGTQNVEVYALNVGGGTNILIGSATVNIAEKPSDIYVPVMQEAYVDNVTPYSFRLNAKVSDNVGVSKVEFETWKDGSPLRKTYTAQSIGNDMYIYDVNISDLTDEAGVYHSIVHAYDPSNNHSTAEIYIIVPDKDTIAPTISDVTFSQVSANGYRITCKISDNIGVTSVKFPTWGGGDFKWLDGEVNGNVATCYINTNDFNNEIGDYANHIYAYDAAGNSSSTSAGYIYVSDEPIEISSITYGEHKYIVYNSGLSWTKAKTWCENHGGYLATITSEAEWNKVLELLKNYNGISCWFGAESTSGSWKWTTGEPFEYANWGGGQPDCNGNVEFYLGTYGGNYLENYNWNDFPDSHYNIGGFVFEKIEHQYEEKVIAPNCTEKGYTLHTCVYCDDNYKDTYTNALGHDYKLTSEKVATCTTDGEKIYTCSRCGDKKTETVKATGHSYTKKVVAPTCTAKGYTLHTCSKCGDSYKDTYTNALGHDYKLTSEKAATCTTDGEKIYTCSRCGDTKTETVKATGHSYTTKVIAPTCTEKGYTLHTCSKCGDNYKDTYTNATGHKYEETIVTPTTTEQGYTLHTCSVCKHSYKDNYTNILLSNNSTLSADTIKLGETIIANAKATGGTGEYLYQVVYKQTTQSKWTTAQSYKANATVTFKPANAVTYDVCVKVKDSNNTEVKKFFTVKVTSDELKNVSTISAQTINLGNTVTVNAKATGSTGFYTYAVYYKQKAQTKWTTKQDFKANNTIAVKPAKATTYDICVKVKDDKGTIVKKYFTVNVTDFTNTSTLSATEIKLGNTVKVSCSATGSTGYYQYAVYYKKTSDTKWTTKQSYSSNNTVTIKPAKATTYDVCVKVKDNQNNEVKKYFTVTVK